MTNPPAKLTAARFDALEDWSWRRDRGDAEDVLRTALPEVFGAMPVYILSYRQIREAAPDVVVDETYCRGFVEDFLSLRIRPALESIGQWRGPGFATAIDTDQCRASDERSGCVLHEATHFVLFDNMRFIRDHLAANPQRPSRNDGFDADKAARALTPTKPLAVAHTSWRPRESSFGHPPTFHRLAAHVAFRARRTGWRGTLYNVARHPYGLEIQPFKWWASLGCDDGEPQRLSDVPIDKIADIPPPADFRRLARFAERRRNKRYRRRLAKAAIQHREQQRAAAASAIAAEDAA